MGFNGKAFEKLCPGQKRDVIADSNGLQRGNFLEFELLSKNLM